MLIIDMSIISLYKDKALIRLYIGPGASKNEVVGVYGDPARLKVKIKAPPIDGEANNEVISYFSKLLGITKGQIQIIRGETSKQKDILVDLSPEEAMKCLGLEK